MKKILLIGDSIRLSYCARVRELLGGKAEVYYTEDNCRFAKYTLWCLREWMALASPAPDIVHWNNGIWDTFRHTSGGICFTPIYEYAEYIDRVYREIKDAAPAAQIIWASTTAVDDAFPVTDNATIDAYNACAAEVLGKVGVPVDDLNAVVKADIKKYISDDLLHLSDAGIEACAVTVAECLEKYI